MSRRPATPADLSGIHKEDVLGKVFDRELIRRLVCYMLPYKRPLLGAMALMPLLSGVRLIRPLLLMLAVDGPIARRDPAGLGLLALVFMAAVLAEFGLQFGHMYLVQVAGQHGMRDLRAAVFRHVQSLSVSFYHRTPLGRLVTRLTTDVESLNDMFAMGVVQIVGDMVTLALTLVAMLLLSPKLALVTLVVVPPLTAFVFVCRIFMRAAYRRIRLWIARVNASVSESVAGIAVIQAFGRQARSAQEFDGFNQAYRDANLAAIRWDVTLYAVVEAVASITVAGLLFLAAPEIVAGAASFGVLVAFIDYVQKFFVPIRDLSAKFTIMQSAMASAERIFGLLDTDETLPEAVDSKPLPGGALGVEFAGVHFAYKAGEPVLRGATLSVKPGEKVAIVGSTGAGKTTLTSLLLRLYDVDDGAIRVGGVDVRDVDLRALRRRMAVVLQDVFLFTGTVRENISLSDPSITEDDLLRACEAVHLDRLLARRAVGLDYEVLERGTNLSAGEKQLLSFARALARNPDLLILDEATSSVDSETEQLIGSAVERLMEGRTSVVVAHRLSTIANADRIVVLHEGQVHEQGTHDELIERRGVYWRLYRLQFVDDSVAAA